MLEYEGVKWNKVINKLMGVLWFTLNYKGVSSVVDLEHRGDNSAVILESRVLRTRRLVGRDGRAAGRETDGVDGREDKVWSKKGKSRDPGLSMKREVVLLPSGHKDHSLGSRNVP